MTSVWYTIPRLDSPRSTNSKVFLTSLPGASLFATAGQMPSHSSDAAAYCPAGTKSGLAIANLVFSSVFARGKLGSILISISLFACVIRTSLLLNAFLRVSRQTRLLLMRTSIQARLAETNMSAGAPFLICWARAALPANELITVS